MSHVSNYNILDDTKCPNFRIIIVERMCKVLSERLIHDSIKIRQEMNVINLITNESNPEQILYNGKMEIGVCQIHFCCRCRIIIMNVEES